MTVFDRLVAQLLDAHPQRARRHLAFPAPRRMVAFAAAAAAVAAIAVAALSAGSSNTPTPAAQPGDAVPAVVPGKTTVAVLGASGHTMPVLHTARALADHGWKVGTIADYPDGRLDSSCVEFTPGHSQAASIIAKQLGIQSLVPPAPDVVAAAGADADVIVLVGADRT